MFSFKSFSFSFIVNDKAACIKANFQKRIDSYWQPELHGSKKWVGKIRSNTITIQQDDKSMYNTFHPVVVFTLKEINNTATHVAGYFRIDGFILVMMVVLPGVAVYVGQDISMTWKSLFCFVTMLLLIEFLSIYFAFLFNYKKWIITFEKMLVADAIIAKKNIK